MSTLDFFCMLLFPFSFKISLSLLITESVVYGSKVTTQARQILLQADFTPKNIAYNLKMISFMVNYYLKLSQAIQHQGWCHVHFVQKIFSVFITAGYNWYTHKISNLQRARKYQWSYATQVVRVEYVIFLYKCVYACMYLSQCAKCFFSWIIVKKNLNDNQFSHACDNFEILIIGGRRGRSPGWKLMLELMTF